MITKCYMAYAAIHVQLIVVILMVIPVSVTVDTRYRETATSAEPMVYVPIICSVELSVIDLDPEPSLLVSYATGGLAKLDTFTRTIETIIASNIQITAFDYHHGYQVGN